MTHASPEIERRALALLERLVGWPANARLRRRLLRNETAEVIARVCELEARLDGAGRRMPTQLPGDRTALDDDAPPPARVGPFRLLERIGQGGMGTVWHAVRDDGLYEQQVAVKFIHPRLTGRAGNAFAAERRILARLEHPGIARLIDGGVAEGTTGNADAAGASARASPARPYLVMEYVDGRPIDEALQDAPLEARIATFLRAADAVQFAHGRLVAHADLKPSNILVDAHGQVKLLDFGIAHLLGDTPSAADDATPVPAQPMTPAFASPERAAGASPSIADDVFALGRTLEHLLTLPRGGTPRATRRQPEPDDRPGAQAIEDAELAAIVAMAGAAREDARYPSVAALISDLVAWQQKRPVVAMHGSAAYHARRFVARHRIGVAATVFAFALLAATSIVALGNYLQAEQARAEATARYQDARGTARYLLFDLLDRLQQQPRALALRADVARVAQHYLDRLARAEHADDSVALEAAAGLWRLAEHQARQGRPNLRQPDAARRNLARAERMAAAIDAPAARRLRALVQVDQAMLASDVDNDVAAAERFLAGARATIATLDAAGSTDADLQRRLHIAEATLHGWQGRFPAMARAAATALRLPPHPDPSTAVRYRATLVGMLGEAAFYNGELDTAEREYRVQMALLAAARRRWPDDNALLSQLSRARWNLGSTLSERRRFAEAAPILAQGVVEARAALAFDPADEDAVRQLRVISTAFAQSLGLLRRTDEALAILLPIEAMDRQRARAHPAEALRQRDHAVSLTMLGEVLNAGGRTAAGCTADAEARDVYTRLRRASRLTPLELDHNIQLLEARMARACRAIAPPTAR